MFTNIGQKEMEKLHSDEGQYSFSSNELIKPNAQRACATTKSNNHTNDHLKIIFPYKLEPDELKALFHFQVYSNF